MRIFKIISLITINLLLGITIILVWKIVFVSKKVKGIQVVNIIDKNNIVYDPRNYKHFFEPEANKYYSDRPDWLSYAVEYKINFDSLNERYDYQIEKKDGIFRIVTLGDSFTFGLFVNTEDNWSELLEDKLNDSHECVYYKKYEVINLGVGAYDVAYAVERYLKRGLKYHPDLIIWLVNSWNISNPREYTLGLEQEYINQGVLRFDKETRDWPAMNKVYKDLDKKYSKNQIIEYSKTAVARLKNYIQHDNLLLVSFKDEIVGNYKDVFSPFSNNKIIELSRLSNDQIFLDYHPNKIGHKVIADEIYYKLKKLLCVNTSN